MAQIYLTRIDELEALVGGVPAPPPDAPAQEAERAAPKKPKPDKKAKPPPAPEPASDAAAPVCTQLEFKVGQITKVWYHEDADKLFCEEISCGEDEPRQIASGLRPHFTLEQMQGQRLLVVANLKAKKLVGFKSHGMVLCAAEPDASHLSGERSIRRWPAATTGERARWRRAPRRARDARAGREAQGLAGGAARPRDRRGVRRGVEGPPAPHVGRPVQSQVDQRRRAPMIDAPRGGARQFEGRLARAG